jgi:hypothetical protein
MAPHTPQRSSRPGGAVALLDNPSARAASLLWLVVALASACASQSASEAPAAQVVDVTGEWAGTWATDDRRLAGDCRLNIKQDGTLVTGVLLMTGVVPPQTNGYIDGTVTNDELAFRRGMVTASLKVHRNTMRGSISGLAGPATLTVQRVGP